MHHTVTDEQISNANRYLKMVSGASLSAAEMNQLATHLQIAAPQLSGDVVEAMIEVYRGRLSSAKLPSYAEEMREAMTAAAQVLLEFEEVYAHKVQDLNAAKFIRRFRNSLLKPAEPTMEEVVFEFITQAHGHNWPTATLAKELVALITRRTGASHDR